MLLHVQRGMVSPRPVTSLKVCQQCHILFGCLLRPPPRRARCTPRKPARASHPVEVSETVPCGSTGFAPSRLASLPPTRRTASFMPARSFVLALDELSQCVLVHPPSSLLPNSLEQQLKGKVISSSLLRATRTAAISPPSAAYGASWPGLPRAGSTTGDLQGSHDCPSITELADTWSEGNVSPSSVAVRVPPLSQSLRAKVPCDSCGCASASTMTTCSPFSPRATDSSCHTGSTGSARPPGLSAPACDIRATRMEPTSNPRYYA